MDQDFPDSARGLHSDGDGDDDMMKELFGESDLVTEPTELANTFAVREPEPPNTLATKATGDAVAGALANEAPSAVALALADCSTVAGSSSSSSSSSNVSSGISGVDKHKWGRYVDKVIAGVVVQIRGRLLWLRGR